MAGPRRSRRPRTTLIVLVVLSISIVTLDARGDLHRVTSGLRSVASDTMAPIREGFDAVVRPIGGFLSGAVHDSAVRQQNAKLRDEIGRLRRQLLQQHSDADALRQLSSLSDLPFVGNLQTVPAEVTVTNTSDFAATIQIDQGRGDGVSVGMPVVAAEGLVGQVVAASHHTATVRLLTDGQSQVGVQYGTAGTPSIVNGTGPASPLSVGLISANTPIPAGTVFSTSGLQGASFPPGIPVARLASARTVSPTTNELVTANPVVDLASLRYVSVVLWGPAS